jgi:glucokinase
VTSSFVAVDVGGTTIKAGLFRAGTLTNVRESPTNGGAGPTHLVGRIAAMVSDVVEIAGLRGSRAVGAGVVLPGVVDHASGVVVDAVNLGWSDVPIKRLLEDSLDVPVAVGHDVRAGAIAEARSGAGRGFDPLLFAAVGTGLGMAVIEQGCGIRDGGNRFTGEIGQLQLLAGGPTVESVVSAPGIAREFERRSGLPERSVDSAGVVGALQDGDAVAAEVWEDAVDQLALLLTSAVLVAGATRVVVGGGLSAAGLTLLGPLRTAMAAHCAFGRIASVEVAAYGRYAACVGAGILASEECEHDRA